MVGGHSDRLRHVKALVRSNPGCNGGNQDVKDCADQQGSNDPDGHVALGILRLLCRSADGVETYICEEDQTSSAKHTGPAKLTPMPRVGRNERMPIGRVDCPHGCDDE